MQLDPEARDQLCQGIHHFRLGDYFAAHDDWEAVWQNLRGRRRMFWQAMIQLVVGTYHLTNGNRPGCENLWKKAVVHCSELVSMDEPEVPAPVGMLLDFLQDGLDIMAHDSDPWPHIIHFAHEVVTEEWVAFE